VPGLPPIGIGREKGEVAKDEEGIAWAGNAGKNMAWLLRHLDRSPLPFEKPAQADDRMTKKKKRE